jgi:hypothetical protein
MWYGEENDWYFKQGNARPHTAKATIQAFERLRIQLLDWLASSPDLEIENVWGIIDRQFKNEDLNSLNTVDKFKTKLRQLFLDFDLDH